MPDTELPINNRNICWHIKSHTGENVLFLRNPTWCFIMIQLSLAPTQKASWELRWAMIRQITFRFLLKLSFTSVSAHFVPLILLFEGTRPVTGDSIWSHAGEWGNRYAVPQGITPRSGRLYKILCGAPDLRSLLAGSITTPLCVQRSILSVNLDLSGAFDAIECGWFWSQMNYILSVCSS